MENEFTPGPWEYSSHHHQHAEGHLFFKNAPPLSGCTIQLTGAAAMSQERLNANGRLMAASPKLFEALNEAMRFLEVAAEGYSEHLNDGVFVPEEQWDKWIAAVDSAIA
jgi:hypothetical protein